MDIDVFNRDDEDIKKHFRITNRFISKAIKEGGKVLIHDYSGKSRGPAFVLAFFINNLNIPLKKGNFNDNYLLLII